MANEKRLIDATEFWNRLQNVVYDIFTVHEKGGKLSNTASVGYYTDTIKEVLKQTKTVDAVSRGVHDQVRWERDVAIGQLESYGISLGEKADVAKVVRCKDCKHWLPEEPERCKALKQEPYGLCNRYPQRTSWQDTTDQDDFCSYGERRDGE